MTLIEEDWLQRYKIPTEVTVCTASTSEQQVSRPGWGAVQLYISGWSWEALLYKGRGGETQCLTIDFPPGMPAILADIHAHWYYTKQEAWDVNMIFTWVDRDVHLSRTVYICTKTYPKSNKRPAPASEMARPSNIENCMDKRQSNKRCLKASVCLET